MKDHDTARESAAQSRAANALSIRAAKPADFASIVALDQQVTGLAKRQYWKEAFARYVSRREEPAFFLVAERGGEIEGFIIGDVRAWEFGEPPCGWVFAVQVRPQKRLGGLGTQLFDAICDAFRRAGVKKVRTLLARENHLVLSFFRSQGLMAGPFIELEATIA
ncbi:MAG: GNAT family N-acetyltransferase [Acidobacteriota bacterium]|nr:GNAT family N-acetyltransferase [Acidobacteriota bacterium]MDE3169722.1 GNAT family N-acetyltransferase [Acidobacteriota bacterium]